MNAATIRTRNRRADPGDDAGDELLAVLEGPVALPLGRLQPLGDPLLDRALPLAAARRRRARPSGGAR